MLAAVLWLMERMGPSWWLWAWGVTTAFSLFAAWIYPTVLAPLFNKFTPLPDGELKDAILDLARRTGFRAGGISVMDASRRTAHGNAYFTGVFGQKRIVLFDTLLEAMGPREVVAVLAHELGHFKLHHVRWGMARGIATSGLVFFALSLCLPLEAFYSAFSLEKTAYGALAVFGLWFGLVSFLLQPLENALSRRHEFAADAFALRSRRDRGRARRRAPQAQREEPAPARHPPALLAGLPLAPAAPRAAAGDGGARGRLRPSAQPRSAPRLLPQREDRLPDPVLVGAEAQDADPEHVAAVDPGAGEEDAPARVDAAQQLGPEAIGVLRRRPQAEGHDRELRLVEHLEARVVPRASRTPSGRGRASRRAARGRRATPWSMSGSQSRRPRKSRESSGERSAKPSEPSAVTSCT